MQAKAFRSFFRSDHPEKATSDTRIVQALGQCMATIGYAQLIAENATRLNVAPAVIAVIFHSLISDLSASALALASLPCFDLASRRRICRMVTVPKTSSADWDFIAERSADRRTA